MADPPVEANASASIVLSPAISVPPDPPDATEVTAERSNKEKEPEINIETSGQSGAPNGDGAGSSHSLEDGETGTCGADRGANRDEGARDPAPDPARNPNPLRLVEAGPEEPWFKAIEKKDCLSLMEILRKTPDFPESRVTLYYRTGKGGRTALHVAAMQGCFPLAEFVIDNFMDVCGKRGEGRSPQFSHLFSGGDTDIIDAKDGRSGLTAFEMANDIIGNTSNTQYMKDTFSRRFGEFNGSLYEAYPGLSRYCWCCSSATLVTCWRRFVDRQFLPWLYRRKTLSCWRWNIGPILCGLRNFLEDVDYNFEDKRLLRFSILRFHYACKDPEKFKDSICGVLKQIHENSMELGYIGDGSLRLENEVSANVLYTCLCLFQDAQGRTPFHTFVDCINYKDDSINCAFSEAFHKCVNLYFQSDIFLVGSNSRGRSPFMRAVINKYVHSPKMMYSIVKLYENWPSENLDQTNSFWSERQFWDESQFCVAILFYDKEVVHLPYAQYINQLSNYYTDTDFYHGKGRHLLHIAAASGNHSGLRLLLKSHKSDPMVVDKNGRTLLHYAADSSMRHFALMTITSSVDDFQKVKSKWNEEEEMPLNMTLNHSNLTKEEAQCEFERTKLGIGRKACIMTLLQAGVDLSQEDKNGEIPDPSATSDTSFQSWWYDTLVKDTLDKKNNFNQAGNALSVVGTLVAATSYIGPLQPPLGYDSVTGYVETSKLFVKVFMVSNTLAFYLAVASVMFAVVPSLPMPQGVIDELRRARHTVSSSLCLLLASIGCILVSFAAASAVVVDSEHYNVVHDILLGPSIIGWFFCLIAIVSFFIRVMRLICYRNSIIRRIYQFSFSKYGRMAGLFIIHVVEEISDKMKDKIDKCRCRGEDF